MAEKFRNKYRIPSARLPMWDYGANSAYFITICTRRRKHFFGEIDNGEMLLSPIGRKANEYWLEIPDHFSFVQLDEFVVMPNHFHGIIIIDKPWNERGIFFVDNSNTGTNGAGDLDGAGGRDRACPVSTTQNPHPRFRNQGKNTISAMVGSFKSAVTKWCNDHQLQFGWQTRFHDHIIRNNDEFNRIRNYIRNNPANWKQDKFYR